MIFVYSKLTVVCYYCLLKKKNCNLYPLRTLLYLLGTDLCVCMRACVLEYRPSNLEF